jgi:hypothetical protein
MARGLVTERIFSLVLFKNTYLVSQIHSLVSQLSTLKYIPICKYGTHHSYVLVVHTLRVAENEILKLDLPAKKRH